LQRNDLTRASELAHLRANAILPFVPRLLVHSMPGYIDPAFQPYTIDIKQVSWEAMAAIYRRASKLRRIDSRRFGISASLRKLNCESKISIPHEACQQWHNA